MSTYISIYISLSLYMPLSLSLYIYIYTYTVNVPRYVISMCMLFQVITVCNRIHHIARNVYVTITVPGMIQVFAK